MTLLINEIQVEHDLRKSLIVFAADRRLTTKGQPPKFMRKIFRIPYLNCGVGYYGLAQIDQREYLASWLANFIRHATECTTPGEFAKMLQVSLNKRVSKALLGKYPSGLHVCGYNPDNHPELWHLSNHEMKGNDYINFSPQYGLSEDFLSRDARKAGFDGHDPTIHGVLRQYYINGDIRTFSSVWFRLDEFLAEMFSNYRDFRRPKLPSDYANVVRWKMEVISNFYQEFADTKFIGKPIDSIILVANQ